MGTYFGYVCLTHTPHLESDRFMHGHGDVHNSDTVKVLLELVDIARGNSITQPQDYAGHSGYTPALSWLAEHPTCRLAVADGYGARREIPSTGPSAASAGSPANPPIAVTFPRGWWRTIIDALRDAGPTYGALADDLDNSVLTGGSQLPVMDPPLVVEPGKSYLLRFTERVPVEAADQIKKRLSVLYPDATFGILTHQMEVVRDAPSPPRVEPHAVRLNDLVATVEQARDDAKAAMLRRDGGDRIAVAGAALAFEMLARALTQTGDVSAPRPTAPAECTATRPATDDTLKRVCHRPPHSEGAHLDGAGWWL
jgi:hypothetical protein